MNVPFLSHIPFPSIAIPVEGLFGGEWHISRRDQMPRPCCNVCVYHSIHKYTYGQCTYCSFFTFTKSERAY